MFTEPDKEVEKGTRVQIKGVRAGVGQALGSSAVACPAKVSAQGGLEAGLQLEGWRWVLAKLFIVSSQDNTVQSSPKKTQLVALECNSGLAKEPLGKPAKETCTFIAHSGRLVPVTG